MFDLFEGFFGEIHLRELGKTTRYLNYNMLHVNSSATSCLLNTLPISVAKTPTLNKV